MTNGGFETIWSNRSPRTGSNRLPCRNSMLWMPLSSALSRARSRARSEMSVATTVRACRAACIAWMPHPVPRSRTLPTGRLHHQAAEGHRCAADAEHVLLAERAAEGEFAEVGDDPPAACAVRVDEAVRAQVEQRARLGVVRRRPGRVRRRRRPRGREGGGQVVAANRQAEHERWRQGRGCVDAASRRVRRASARRAGTLSLRCSAASASSPHRPVRVVTVNRAESRSERRRCTSSEVTGLSLTPAPRGWQTGRTMKTLLNIIWVVLSGFWLFVGYMFAALIMFVLIVTIPWGIAAARIGVYALWPFGKEVVDRPTAGIGSVLGNVVWVMLAGWWIALGHIVSGVAALHHDHRHPVRLGQLQDGAGRAASSGQADRRRLRADAARPPDQAAAGPSGETRG